MNELTALGTFARSIGRTQQQIWIHQTRPGFPEPAMIIPESGRVKKLWERSALDRYFRKLSLKRQAEHEARELRARTKQANAELYRHCVFIGGPIDAVFIREGILASHDDDPIRACESMGIAFVTSQ